MKPPPSLSSPTATQIEIAAAVVKWYLARYWRTAWDPGVLEMFCDHGRVGAFAVDPSSVAAGEGSALFRVWFMTAMFQRRQDVQILRILRGIDRRNAAELSSARRLLSLVDGCRCPRMRSTDALRERCDLAKDARGRGVCRASPRTACHLKRHTVLLKRYGHFGKVPTSLALVVRESGARDLNGVRAQVLVAERDPLERARALEAVLSRAWRVNQKIASMFLSAVTNPDLGRGPAWWRRGLDWTYFVVVDSNVDLFLESIGYRGGRSYDQRREFVRELARGIDLRVFDRRLRAFNPRLVQQAMYLFMSGANRRASPIDCAHLGRAECSSCPAALRSRCPVRSQ